MSSLPFLYASMAKRRRIEKDKQNETPKFRRPKFLPEELVLKILEWLPVKSIVKCRSVCKSWNSILSSPKFKKTHLLNSIYDSHFTLHRLLFSSNINFLFELKNMSISSVFNKQESCELLEYPDKPHESVWIVCSCYGLVLLVIKEESIYIWNPSTRKSTKLPNPNLELQYSYSYIVYGFGFCHSDNDFKVLAIRCVYRDKNVYDTRVKLYSLNANRWKCVEGFPYSLPNIPYGPLDDSGRFVNQNLHWISCRGSEVIIVSFDLIRERFGEVSQPTAYGEGKYTLTLGTLRDCLSILCNRQKSKADVWVMNEYGVKDSWTKLFSISYVGEPSAYSPLFISANGDILLKLESRILIYHCKDAKFEDVNISDFTGCVEACMYNETLFPFDDSNFRCNW